MKNKLLFFSKSFLFIGTVCLISGIGNLLEKGKQADQHFIDQNATLTTNKNDDLMRNNASITNYEEFVSAVEDESVDSITLEKDIKVPEFVGNSINDDEQIILHGVHELNGQGHKIYYEGNSSLKGSLITSDLTYGKNSYFSSISNLEISNIGSFIGEQYIKSYTENESISINYENLLFDDIDYKVGIETSIGLFTNRFLIYFNDSLGAEFDINFSNIYFLGNKISINYLDSEIENTDINFSFLIGEIIGIPPSEKKDVDPELTLNFHGIFFDSNTVEFNQSRINNKRNDNGTFSFLTKFNLLRNDEETGNFSSFFKPKFSYIFIQNNTIQSNNKSITSYLLFNANFYDSSANPDQLKIKRNYYLSNLLILNNTFNQISFHEWIHDEDLLEKDICSYENIYYISPTYDTDFFVDNQMNLITKGFDLISESSKYQQIEIIDYLVADSSLYNTIHDIVYLYMNPEQQILTKEEDYLRTSFIPVYSKIIQNNKTTLVVSKFSGKFAEPPSFLETWKNTITYNRQKDMVTFDFKFHLNLGIGFNQQKKPITSANLYSNNQLIATNTVGSEVDRNNNYALTFNFIEKINYEDFIYSDLKIDLVFENKTISNLKTNEAKENFFAIEPLSKDGLNLEKDYFLEVNIIILLSLLLLLFVAIILAIVFRLSKTKKRNKKTKEEIFITTNGSDKYLKKSKQQRLDYRPVSARTTNGAKMKPKYLTSGNVYQNSEYVDQNKNQKQKISHQWNQENNQYDSFKDYNQYDSDDYYQDQFGTYDSMQTDYYQQDNQNVNSNHKQEQYYDDPYDSKASINPNVLVEDVYDLEEFDEWEEFI